MISLRSYTTFLFLSLLAGSCFADSATIRWNTHYGNAKRVAQATKRPLLVVIENSRDTTNLIDERELDSDARKKILQKDYELVRVDANTDYGKRVAEAFGVRKFPYTAVTDDLSKQIVYRKSGPMTKSDWTVALAKTPAIPVGTTTVSPATATTVVSEEVVYEVQPTVYPQVISQPATIQQPTSWTAPGNVFAPEGVYQIPATQCFT